MSKKDYSELSKEQLIELVEKLESKKKYGLVWDEERVPEQVVLDCRENLPVLTEVKEREIQTSDEEPTHILIEGDNYHALSVLNYTHAGKIDLIYIDPPYNTGAKDWKYNNKYVDDNDTWAHSKWLQMMKNRLVLARNLLKSDTGVLIVTIDEHEVHNLGLLLKQELPDATIQMVTIVINQKGVAQGRLSRAEEYAFFCFMPEATVAPHPDDLLSPERPDTKRFSEPRWEWLLRGGTNSRREDRPKLFFPIYVDPERRAITEIGDPLPLLDFPDIDELTKEKKVAFPIRGDGSFGNWRVSPPTLRDLLAKGYVKLGGYDEKRKTWTVLYLGQKAQKNIEAGKIKIVDRNGDSNAVKVEFVGEQERQIKTVWHRSTHDSGVYGSSVLRNIIGNDVNFPFPKSIHAVRDALSAIVKNNKDALILDFFAGSGTTGHAVLELNKQDGGKRQFILCTNNENNICEQVTYKRIGNVIKGYTMPKGEQVEGLAGNLRYFKTSFVQNTENKDQLRIDITRRCTEMLCLKEGIYKLRKETEDWKIFEENNKYLAVYYDFPNASLDELRDEMNALDGEKVLYCFTVDPNGLDKEEFSDWENIRLEPIPQKILDVYKQIFQ